MCSAGFSSLVAAVITHPLHYIDHIKHTNTDHNFKSALSELTQNGLKVKNLYMNFTHYATQIVLRQAIVFMFYDTIRRQSDTQFMQRFMNGMVAAAAACLIVHPLEKIRRKVEEESLYAAKVKQRKPFTASSLLSSGKYLYQGFSATFTRFGIYYGLLFALFEKCNQLYVDFTE